MKIGFKSLRVRVLAIVALVLLAARGEIKAGRMTVGLFVSFAYALFKAYEPVKRLGNVYQLFLQAVLPTWQPQGSTSKGRTGRILAGSPFIAASDGIGRI
jgi:ABC-type multidrug transport system fused ATPase/permease subunit